MDIYKEVTDRIIHQMEQGNIPWQKPWVAAGAAISHTTGKPYSLLNQMLLGQAGEYLTFKQCQQEGGKVRKGAKAQMIVFWKWLKTTDEETQEEKEVPFLRYFNVFHVDQCEGISPKHMQENPYIVEPHAKAQSIMEDYQQRENIVVHHQEGNQAYYQPSCDAITLPIMQQFSQVAEYYSVAFHEMIHSTGHKSRLDRLCKAAFFGSEAYSKEELVAEIGASALVHHVGLETASSFQNNTAYVQNWLAVLKDDKRFIVSASSKAEKAVDYILAGH